MYNNAGAVLVDANSTENDYVCEKCSGTKIPS